MTRQKRDRGLTSLRIRLDMTGRPVARVVLEDWLHAVGPGFGDYPPTNGGGRVQHRTGVLLTCTGTPVGISKCVLSEQVLWFIQHSSACLFAGHGNVGCGIKTRRLSVDGGSCAENDLFSVLACMGDGLNCRERTATGAAANR